MNRYTLVSKDDQICFDIDVFYLEILFGIEMAWWYLTEEMPFLGDWVGIVNCNLQVEL